MCSVEGAATNIFAWCSASPFHLSTSITQVNAPHPSIPYSTHPALLPSSRTLTCYAMKPCYAMKHRLEGLSSSLVESPLESRGLHRINSQTNAAPARNPEVATQGSRSDGTGDHMYV